MCEQYRVFQSILKHCILDLPAIPAPLLPSSVFTPVITTSYCPLTESDYNFHKSNSTYFSDLDVTRSHLICALFQPGLKKLHHNTQGKLVCHTDGSVVKERFLIMLGGVHCSFKREIGIYQGYEMWSRILCWDRKWVYVITHFVKKGAVKPSAYIVADGTWFGKGYKEVKGHYSKGADVDEKAIFASAISKYVVKLGRLTVHPEVLLGASGLLPPRPGGWHSMASGESTPEESAVVESDNGDKMEESMEVVETNEAQEHDSNEWDWKRIDAKNKEGLKYAEHFAALDGLNSEFSGSSGPALGKFKDFLLI